MVRAFREDDVGKRVVIADGTGIGQVVEVTDETARVDPDPGVTDRIAARLGWSEADRESYALRAEDVDSVTDDEVRLSAGGVDVT